LIAEHSSKVFAYLTWLGADRELAEDLTQETYAKAWRGLEDLRDIGSVRAWLLRIARNEYFQVLRRPRLELLEIDAAHEVADGSPGTLARRAVQRLEPALAEAIVLHYFQALRFRDVASLLGIPVGTVKSRVNRALADLRTLLREEEGHGEERSGETTARTS
jgi:RNA polymerase sigma-70 factor (ECF subfamily)